MSPSLRVAHVVTTAGPDPALGGPLRVALDQARELRSRGHDVTLVGGWDDRAPGPVELEGVPTVLAPVRVLVSKYAMSSRMSRQVVQELRRCARTSDVVHVHLGRDAVPLVAAIEAHRARTPYVAQTHGMIAADSRLAVRAVDAMATRRALSRATHRLVLTDDEARDLRAIVPEPTTLLRNGIPIPSGPLRGRPSGSGPPEVLFFGRLHPNKQPLVFARSAVDLHRQGIDARFVIVGPDHGELDHLQRFIAEHQAQAYLRYEGVTPISQSRERLSRADVFVQPTLNEPFGLSALQAMAEGVPSIVTTGFVIAPEIKADAGALVVEPTTQGVSAGIRALLGNTDEREELARRGYEMVRSKFSMPAVVDQLEGIYEEALNIGRPLPGGSSSGHP